MESNEMNKKIVTKNHTSNHCHTGYFFSLCKTLHSFISPIISFTNFFFLWESIIFSKAFFSLSLLFLVVWMQMCLFEWEKKNWNELSHKMLTEQIDYDLSLDFGVVFFCSSFVHLLFLTQYFEPSCSFHFHSCLTSPSLP